jgi:uncharacterized protein YutE (UPF0331/DUF86 family)
MAEEYFDSVLRHAEQCAEELDELGTILQNRRWTRLEQRAAERSLQLLVEACIGVAKRWVKHLGLTVPLDAYPCFEKLVEKGLIAPHPPDSWRKIVGLRNVRPQQRHVRNGSPAQKMRGIEPKFDIFLPKPG